jgi:hypothetical protein
MPTRTNKRPAARTSRKGARGRKIKKGSGRKASRQQAPAAPAIISNSIFAVTLKSKPGIEVAQKMDGKMRRHFNDDLDDYPRMYTDLSQACFNARKLLGQNPSKPDLLASGLGIGTAMSFITGLFENSVLPAGYNYSIDRDQHTGEYFFTVYDTCDYKEYWHAFELRPVVEHLKKTNRKLHNFFLQFIKVFMAETGIYAWWNGGCHYAEDFLEDEILNWGDRYGGDEEYENRVNEEYIDMVATQQSYAEGYVYEYRQKLERCKALPVATLQKKLKGFNQRNRLVKWMEAACKFMARPACINAFINYEVFEAEFNGEGIEFDGYASVIWDWDDAYTRKHMEFIDSESQNCGVMPPIVSIRIEKKTKKIDYEALKQIADWPMELNKVWEYYHSIAESLKIKPDERTDGTIEVHL